MLNLYGAIILIALLGEHLLGIVSDVLTLRHASPTVPEEFADVYAAEAYETSQTYLRVRTRFGWVRGTVRLAAALVFWFAGGFRVLDGALRSHISSDLWRGLAFIAVLLLLQFAVALPFDLVSTFRIEERFGFNRTTWRTFVSDRIKGALLAVAIGGPILAAVLWFFQAAGGLAWLYCWAVLTVVSLVLQIVAPIWIFPLFNRFTPLEDGELRTAILSYAERVAFPVARLFKIDGSRRSTHSNAYVTGFGRTRRVALFDTLIDRHSVPELVAVVAHEVGHAKHHHVLKGMAVSILHSGLMLYLLSIFLSRDGLFAAFAVSPSVYAGLVFFGLLYTPLELLLSVAVNGVSRRHEYQADRYAAESTGDPRALADALRGLSVHNLSNLTPHALTVILEYSHPPVLARVRALAALAATGAPPGEALPDDEDVNP